MRNNVEADYGKQRGGSLCETRWRQAMRNNVDSEYKKQRGGRI